MQRLLRDGGGEPQTISIPSDAGGSVPLVAVLWRRRWTLLVTTLVCLACAGVYLMSATPIYSATSRLLVQQNAPKILSDGQGFYAQSDSYLQTQADAMLSGSVLEMAVKAVREHAPRTFEAMQGDAAAWLRRSGALKIEAARKSDIIVVSMESPYAQEAAAVVNGIVHAFLMEQSQRKRTTGGEMVRVLQKEKEQIEQRREQRLAAMLKFQRNHGVLSFNQDKGNIVLERTASLSSALTSAEITTMELRAELEATKAALADPATIAAFVESRQYKARDTGDREYDELRSQLAQQQLSLSTMAAIQGERNPRVELIHPVIDSLKARIAEKELAIAEAHLVGATAQLAAAEKKERDLRAALEKQRGAAMDLSPEAQEFAKLESEVAQLQKQGEMLDGRIAEISVNSIESAPANFQVLEPARAEQRPIRPRKALVLAAALMVGWVLGIGAAMVREWLDARLRMPEEISGLLGVPVIAMVPKMNSRLSPVARGQVMHLDGRSPVAEAFRSARTSLQLGAGREAKTFLMASPTPGDGKSTTASNLAIAFAQGGHRTLLLDCDLREPVQHLIFEANNEAGLSSVVAGEVKLRDALRPTQVPDLFLLPCGPVPASPSELLASKRFAQLMQSLLGMFDRIVIDSPPLMTAADARILAASADATLLVLRMNKSLRKMGEQAVDGLERVGANLLGAMANDVPASRAYQYYGGSWQYAVSAKRLLASANGGRSNGNGNGGARVPRQRPELPEEILAFDEPDWTAEPH